MNRKRKQALGRLRALAALKRDAEMAQLSALARTRARLQAAVDALDQHRPVLSGARDWRMADLDAAEQEMPGSVAKAAVQKHREQQGQRAEGAAQIGAAAGQFGASDAGIATLPEPGASPLHAAMSDNTALGDADANDSPAMIRARLRHRRWVEAQRSLLNQRLARVTADWLTRRPAAIRAFGRVSVLDRLAIKAKGRRIDTGGGG